MTLTLRTAKEKWLFRIFSPASFTFWWRCTSVDDLALKGVAVSGFSIPIYSCKFVPRIILVTKSFILQPPLFLQTQTSLFNFENGTSFSNLSPYNRSGIELSSEGQRTHQLDARPIRNALFFSIDKFWQYKGIFRPNRLMFLNWPFWPFFFKSERWRSQRKE